MNIKYHLDNLFINSPAEYGGVKLYQVGRIYCGNGFVVSDHEHADWFEVTIVTDGEGVVVTDGIEIPVRRSDIYLSFPHDVHGIRSGFDKPLKYDYFAFSVSDLPLKEGLEQVMREHCSPYDRTFHDERIGNIAENLISEYNNPDGYMSRETVSYLLHLAPVYIIRNMRSGGVPERRPSTVEALCYTLMNYMDTHIYTMKNLEELAGITGYNYCYLSSLFKKHTSNSLSEYFRGKKLEEAGRLITENKLTETKIAELLNYSSLYSFIKAFRAHFGVSPGEYRKRERDNV